LDRLLAVIVFLAGILLSFILNRFVPVRLRQYSLAVADPRWRDCRARRERPVLVPAPANIQKFWRRPAGLLRLRSPLFGRERSAQGTAVARRKLVADLLKKPPERIRLSDELRGTKDELLRVAQEFGLEGLVAKRPNSLYESGRRSGASVKLKITKSQEFVIGGYTLPEGSRKYFGSLLVGYNKFGRARVRRQS
jgi:hypothetical protein